MKVVVLNGSETAGDGADRAAAALETRFASETAEVRHYVLRGHSIGHCLGEFDCWVRTPGRCRIKDEGQEIERAVHDADIVAFATPVMFGGYGPQLKKAFDRLIPLILPFFAKRADLTHHAYRYAHLPRMIGVGVDAINSPERAKLFSAFVESNALNLGSPTWNAHVMGTDASLDASAFSSVLQPGSAPGNASRSAQGAREFLEAMVCAEPMVAPFTAAPRIAVLQASAREPGTSTSQSIAAYFAAQCKTAGACVDIVPATNFARDPATAESSARVLADADVLVVISPLYVDALPYIALLGLQKAHALRGENAKPQPVVGIINCGFPEPEQTRFAFAVLRNFARETASVFAGGLSVGGGEIIHGRDLVKAGGVTIPLRRALDASAAALGQGGVIPKAVSLSLARPLMAPFLFRFAGSMHWSMQARAHGMTSRDLRATPFDVMSDKAWEDEAASGTARARPLRVVGKTLETDDAITLHFEDPAHDPLSYQAGQYITLELEINGARVRRAYSLASAPDEPGLAITVKRVAGGLVSNHIHDAVRVGDILRSHGPSGHFVAGDAHNLLLFGGGSGIVPLAAITRTALRRNVEARVTLIYGASSKARAIDAVALDGLAAEEPDRLSIHWVLEAPGPDWSGPRGRLDEVGIGALLDALKLDAFDAVMLCGPDAMRASVRALLASRGVDPRRIAEESFTSPRAATASTKKEIATLASDAGAGRAIAVAPGKTLLEAVLDAGEAISFSCMTGGCGACRVTVTEGLQNVAMDEPNDVSAEDRARGALPACLCRLNGPISFKLGVDPGGSEGARRE